RAAPDLPRTPVARAGGARRALRLAFAIDPLFPPARAGTIPRSGAPFVRLERALLFLHETPAMSNTTRRGPRGRLLLFSLAALALFAPPARPADVDKAAPSRRLVPADAELYSVMLRNAEQWKMLTSSNAWAKLTDLQVVQMGWQQVQKQLNDPKNPLVQFFKAKENQELLELLGDMVS